MEDLFGGNDATVKYVLEGHDRGVNWAAFHHSLPLIVSGADDRQVKLWRMNETKAWEVDTLRGHINNVSCALFHPKQELIVSNSEDKSIRVWDMSKRQGVQTFRREHDRFWILASHPDSNLLAAGHDGGMIVFKLERERPAYTPLPGGVLFIKDRYVRQYEYQGAKETLLMCIRRPSTSGSAVARSVQYNEQEAMLLVSLDAEGGSYELYHVAKDSSGGSEVTTECKRGLGTSAVFVARQRFAVLDKNRQILIKNFQNEVTKKCAPPHPSTDMLFAAGTGSLLLRSEERISLFDIQQRKAVAEVTVPATKYVVWSADGSHVALISKHGIAICDRKLNQLCSVHDTIRVKSGAWDGNDVFYFSTLNHLKYLLANGDTGIIRTLEVPLYISSASNGTLHCLDREGKVRKIAIDPTECQFKLCLHKKEFDKVVRIIKQAKLSGHAIIAYLQKKGYPQVALHFVQDEQTRFNLAVECGNIDVALTAAGVLDSKENWQRLGMEALKQGNHQIVEMAYQRTKDMERLSFLYLITGNIDKLRKMLKIAEMRTDTMSRFHNALYLGDVEQRVALLIEVGHLPLAYLTAKAHALHEQVEAIVSQLEASGLAVPEYATDTATLLYPPLPILREANWPLLTVSKDTFSRIGDGSTAADGGGAGLGVLDDDLGGDGGAGWGDDLDLNLDGPGAGGPSGGDPFGGSDDPFAGEGGEGGEGGEAGGGGWGDDLDIDLGDVALASDAGGAGGGGSGGYYVAPQAGMPAMAKWSRDSQLSADHVAAGSFESAMQLMRRQLGIIDFTPLKDLFLAVASASHAVSPGVPSAPPLLAPLMRGGGSSLPRKCITLPLLVEKVKAAYAQVTAGKFVDAQDSFRNILYSITLTIADTRQQVSELKELMGICMEYLTALRLEVAKGKTTDNKRKIELAAYFTHCNLSPAHTLLSLRSAMTMAYKLKLFKSAGSFARRLLELNPKPDIATTARKIVQVAESNPTDEFEFDYDERNPFVVCAADLVPIYRGSALVRCSLCKANYQPKHKGKKCDICLISEVGGEAAGIDEQSVLAH